MKKKIFTVLSDEITIIFFNFDMLRAKGHSDSATEISRGFHKVSNSSKLICFFHIFWSESNVFKYFTSNYTFLLHFPDEDRLKLLFFLFRPDTLVWLMSVQQIRKTFFFHPASPLTILSKQDIIFKTDLFLTGTQKMLDTNLYEFDLDDKLFFANQVISHNFSIEIFSEFARSMMHHLSFLQNKCGIKQ